MSEIDRIENEKLDFHMKVYDGYKNLAELYPNRIKTIDSKMSINEISQRVIQVVVESLKMR